ncbi:MAG: hypothetical protein ACK57G_04375, partial [Planctomycetota bacterium]
MATLSNSESKPEPGSTPTIGSQEDGEKHSLLAGTSPDIPADSDPPSTLQLPYRPRVAAGWRIPGVGRYKINQWLEHVRAVNALETSRRALSEPQIRKAALSLVYRAKSGETLASLLPETYSLIREAARRRLNMRHYDVQI